MRTYGSRINFRLALRLLSLLDNSKHRKARFQRFVHRHLTPEARAHKRKARRQARWSRVHT